MTKFDVTVFDVNVFDVNSSFQKLCWRIFSELFSEFVLKEIKFCEAISLSVQLGFNELG